MDEYKIMLEKINVQEKMLRFKHFTNQDALELGNFIIAEANNKKIAMAVAIRKVNGSILFHHLMDGTALSNQKWMFRKFNTVCYTEHASLRNFVTQAGYNDSIKNHGLSEDEYVFCGGGFPIILETGEFVAVVTVSNLPHTEDHQFLIDCLSKWLNVNDIPKINF